MSHFDLMDILWPQIHLATLLSLPISTMPKLPYDVSSYLCHNFLEGDALRSFSTGNKEMRDIATPKLFAQINIRGNWDTAENVIGCLHANPGLCEHVR